MSEEPSPKRRIFVGFKVPAPIAGPLAGFGATCMEQIGRQSPAQTGARIAAQTGTEIEAQSGLQAGAIRWTSPEDLHVTLRFIGAFPDARLPSLIGKLKSIRWRRFEADILGADVFADAGALVVDIAMSEALAGLHDAISGVLLSEGILPERRPYRPHVTLGRWSRSARLQPEQLTLLRNQLDRYCRSLPSRTFAVYDFLLYETVSRHYRVVERFTLEV